MQQRRVDNIELSRPPSGIRHHSNPYSEVMGPIVTEGFVADRIRRLQGAQSKLGLPPQRHTPKGSHPISEGAEIYESCSSPEPDLVVPDRRSRSFGPKTPEGHTKKTASCSFSEKRWVRSSPSTPVLRVSTGAALYWDRESQSLRHPPTREALEIRRLRKVRRSYENVRKTTSRVPETPSKCSKNQQRLEEPDTSNAQCVEEKGPILAEETEISQSGLKSHKPSIADHMDDMIHHIDQALQGSYDSSADSTNGIQAPGSHHYRDDWRRERNNSPRRQLFKELQSTHERSLSDFTRTSHEGSLRSYISAVDTETPSAKDKPAPSMRDSSFNAQSRRRNSETTETIAPRSSSGAGWYPTNLISLTDHNSQTSSLYHPSALENIHQFPVHLRSLSASHTPPRVGTREAVKSPEEPIQPELSESYRSIPEEPKCVQLEVSHHQQGISKDPALFSRQPASTNRKASVSSIRSASSQGSKKWRWWKLALVDKQPNGQEPRKRNSTPLLGRIDSQASKQVEDEEKDAAPHLRAETTLESEAEREHAIIDEILDGSPDLGPPAPHSPSLAGIRSRRSSQWVAALPSPGSTVSASQKPSRPGSLRASVGQGAKKRDQRIKKVQVIVSLDGTSDLVVEASLERKRRKSFS